MEAKNQYKKKVEFGQDIYDLCLQEYGSLNSLFLLLADNPTLDLKRQLVAGEELKFRIVLPVDVSVNKNLMDDYRNNQTRVNNHDEVQTLEDGCPILAEDGSPILAENLVQILIDNCSITEPTPEIISGITDSEGNVIIAENGVMILPDLEPFLVGNEQNGFSILAENGNAIEFDKYPIFYVTAENEVFIQSEEGIFII
jgi:hypothetical protein